MTTITEKIDGDLLISDEVYLCGLVTGSISVADQGNLEHYGMCCRNLIVQRGGRAEVHGMVNGDVVNRGGEISIFGLVRGSVITEDGQTHIDDAAVIKKGRGQEKGKF